MVSKDILQVKTLGKLSITDGRVAFPQEKRRSIQVELLIIYLILNRNYTINNQQLIDFLWPEGNSDKPEGALRNLVYRARKEFKKLFNGMDVIKSKGHSYFWNQDVCCIVDYEDVILISNQIIKESDVFHKYNLCIEMLNRYQGEFLPDFNYNDWIIQSDNSLERNCLESLLATLKQLTENNIYEEIIRICDHPNCQKIMDTRIYEYKLYAYYKTKKIDQAIQFYRQTVDYYYSKFGVEVSTKFKEIYKMIIDSSSVSQVNVDQLEKTLVVDNSSEQTFYCDFDIFKNIYQINVRFARRTMKARVLALLTIVDQSNSLSEKELIQEADILKKVIANNLRKNDVFSKFNMTQYSLILAVPNVEGAQVAIDRIINRFNEKKKHHEIFLNCELKKIR